MSVLGLSSKRLLPYNITPGIEFFTHSFQINGIHAFSTTGSSDPTSWAEIADTLSGDVEDFNFTINPYQRVLIDYTLYATSVEPTLTRNIYLGLRLYKGANPVDNEWTYLVISAGDTLGLKLIVNLPQNHGYTEIRATWRQTAPGLVYIGDSRSSGYNQGGIMKITSY